LKLQTKGAGAGKQVARRRFLYKTILTKGGFWQSEKKTFWPKMGSFRFRSTFAQAFYFAAKPAKSAKFIKINLLRS
jgi:hypothetical protein